MGEKPPFINLFHINNPQNQPSKTSTQKEHLFLPPTRPFSPFRPSRIHRETPIMTSPLFGPKRPPPPTNPQPEQPPKHIRNVELSTTKRSDRGELLPFLFLAPETLPALSRGVGGRHPGPTPRKQHPPRPPRSPAGSRAPAARTERERAAPPAPAS